jgi:hypothetical protein
MNFQHVEPVPEICTKFPHLNFFSQISIRRRYQQHVYIYALSIPKFLNFTVFKSSQEFGLRLSSQFTHFIQEQDSFMGRFKKAFSFVYGTGECTLARPEELTLDVWSAGNISG